MAFFLFILNSLPLTNTDLYQTPHLEDEPQ